MVAILPSHWTAIVLLALAAGGTAAVVRTPGNRAMGLGIVILGIFGLQVAYQLFVGPTDVVRSLGLVPMAFLAGDQWWAPFSHMYLHAGIGHAIGNLFILLTAGPALEDEIGGTRFLVIYFLAGLAGAASHVGLALLEVVPAASTAVGASGAIFGVLTTFAMLKPREKLPIPVYIIVWVPSIAVLLAFLAFNVALIFTAGSSTAWWAHLAGFLVGLLASAYIQEVGGPSTHGAVDPASLEPLATTDELERILDRIRRVEGTAEDDAHWTEIWLEEFAEAAECPRCGADLAVDGDALACTDGDFRRELREREVDTRG
jgi:membrane associated rhomboid family serine protease